MASVYTSAQIAEDLFANVKFKALKLGTFFGTPEGQFLAAAVEAVMPQPYREDMQLLVEALRLAAQKQHEAAKETFLNGLAVTIGLGALAAALRGSS